MLRALFADIARRLSRPDAPVRDGDSDSGAEDSGTLLARARAYLQDGDTSRARRNCRAAITRGERVAEAWELLALAALEAGDEAEACRAFESALETGPETASALCNAAEMNRRTGNLSRAGELCERALRISPAFARALHVHALVLRECWRVDEALALLERALAADPAFENARSSYLFLLGHLGADPALVRQAHCRWADIHAEPLKPADARYRNPADPEKPLRVGYVSGDFFDHAVSRFAMTILEGHHGGSFRVHCYSNTRWPDEVTVQLRRLAPVWREIAGASDEDAAKTVRDDAIDLLVDLSGHTRDGRLGLFARKPAPVQLTYLGYGGTTGMSAIDYRISDAIVDPPGASEHAYRETLMRLPHSMWCFRPPHGTPPVRTLPALGAGHVTFGSFNSLLKLTPRTVATWASIMQSVRGSRLVLLAVPEGEARERLTKAFENAGVAPSRLEFHARLPRTEYWAMQQRIDIALDSFPYNGATTSCECLWMGIPVVSLAGRLGFERSGASILSAMGLTELLARSEPEYVEIGVRLARDLGLLGAMRTSLRGRMSASLLMDSRQFVSDLERLYRTAWRRWCAGAAAAGGNGARGPG